LGLWGRIKRAARRAARAAARAARAAARAVAAAARAAAEAAAAAARAAAEAAAAAARAAAEAARAAWKAIIVVAVIGVAVLLVGSIILGAIAMSITNDGVPVWGNYCGPGHGDDPQEKPSLDAVDEACKKHDKCYGDNYFGCDCDLQLLADLPGAIAEEAAKGNTAAVAAGEAILAYFSAQTPVTCAVDAGRTVGGWVEDAWDAVT